jgi:hypothetical protein
MFTALTDATGQIDPKFLISYWVPALVATFGSVGLIAILVGPEFLDVWADDLDAVEQILFGAVLLGVASVLSLCLKALRRPIMMLFAGEILPHPVGNWACGRQRRAKLRVEQAVLAADESDIDFSLRQNRRTLERVFPQGSEHVRPTRFGNVMANLEEHSAFVHGMDHWLWWPRLAPLLPDTMSEIVASELANTTGLLNLSLVWAAIALVGAAVFGVAGELWTATIAVLAGGLLLSWLSYQAAVAEGAESGRNFHAAYDLYRHEILKQMELEIPGDREAERALWKRLSTELLGRSAPVASDSAAPSALTKTAKAGATRHQPSASRTTGAARITHN